MPRIAPRAPLGVRPAELGVDEHEAARVRDEVGRVDDAAAGEVLRQRVVGELVVGGAADDAGAQRRHGGLVEHAAERARREHVDVGEQRIRGRHPGHAVELGGERALALVDVGHDHPHAVGDEHAHELLADVAGADDRRGAAGERAGAEAVGDAGADRGMHAERRVRARVAEAAEALRQPDDVLGARGDQAHVGRRRADVLRRDVAAAEQLDGVGEVEQHRVAQLVRELGARLDADDALAAAEADAGDGRLEGHARREPQRVRDRRAGVGVCGHPAAAERGPELRRVHRDDRVRAAARTAADVDQLVVDAGQTHLLLSPFGSETHSGSRLVAGAGGCFRQMYEARPPACDKRAQRRPDSRARRSPRCSASRSSPVLSRAPVISSIRLRR